MSDDIRDAYRAMRWREEMQRAQMRTAVLAVIALLFAVAALLEQFAH